MTSYFIEGGVAAPYFLPTPTIFTHSPTTYTPVDCAEIILHPAL